jgi:VanZ like protein
LKKLRNLVIIITLIMSVMLFTSNPVDSSVRLYSSLWNTGHLFFFAAIIWLIITHTSLLHRSWPLMLMVSVVLSLLLGGAIEVLQYFSGRYMEWQDLLIDVLGALLGVLVVLYFLPLDRRPLNRFVIVLLSVVVLLGSFYPVFNVIRDNQKIETLFPMIADFETVESLSHWGSHHVVKFEIDERLRVEGHSSGLINFERGEYPAASLNVLFPDWSAYNFLNMSIYNDQDENLKINIKVYDRQHRKTGSKYRDRFNTKANLSPGWNQLQFKLLDIFYAPSGREMDLNNIAGVTLFLHDPEENVSIHLDNIHLSK